MGLSLPQNTSECDKHRIVTIKSSTDRSPYHLIRHMQALKFK